MKSFSLNLVITFILLITACSKKEVPIIVKFEGALSEKKWAIKELNSELPSDWSTFEFLTFEINSSTTQRFDIRLYDAEGIRRLTIQPFQGVWVRASIPLIHFQKRNTKGMDMAAISKTARPGYWIGFSGSVGSINHIDSLGVAMRQPIDSPTLKIRNVRLTMAAEDTILGPRPLVDEFGQWIPADWEGKAKTLDDLKNAWSEEEMALKSNSFNVSKYGGFLDTKANATGFFHVEKINNKWWFVDPEGHLFFSAGSTCINARSEFARIQGREYIFTAMPPAELSSPNYDDHRSPNSSFYTWNLYRRFGTDWYQKWMDLTIRRMDNWGINTIGNWSDPILGGSHRKAYVATLRGWGIEAGVMGMPDVYDPNYAGKIDAVAAQQCAPRKDDPYLLGYFIGNELPWPNRESELVTLFLAGEETPIQVELKKYLVGGDTPERRKAFIYNTYAKFLSMVNSAIKKHDPNHLNLGIRYGGSPPDDIIKVSKGFDVFSLNIYGYSVNSTTLDKIYDFTGLPIIIGEFHFGTPGRGLAPGLAQTRNQEERGVAYRYYVENAAAHPALIGTHWFQWIDQPSTGREDGENYNIGFLDVTDRPYPEMVNAAKETFIRLLDVHSGKVPPLSRKAITQ
jgi:hypothetical protein